AFNTILDRALAKSAEKRYQRAGDLANDLRNFKALAGAAPVHDPNYAKTMVVPRPAQHQPQAQAKADAATTTLIDDLNVFAKGFEKQQEESLRAEAAERQRKEEEIQRWAEAEAKRREAFDRERDAKTGITQGGTRKSAALELLRQKVADRTQAVSADQ